MSTLKFAVFRRLLSVLFAIACLSVGNLRAVDPPDLSQLTDEQKSQGVGQLQKSEPDNSRSPSDDGSQDRRERQRREEERLKQQRLHQQRTYLGAGVGATAGTMVLGSNLQQNRMAQSATDASTAIVDPNPSPEDPTLFEERQWVDSEEPKSLNIQTQASLQAIGCSVNALFYRDLVRFDAQLVDGINSNQIGWSGASGIESHLNLFGAKPSDYGLHLGFGLIGGSDEANSSNASTVYTKPNIAFSPHPFLSQRDLSLATIESNVILQTGSMGQKFGLRWLHLEDKLTAQVLPNGISDRIKTNSNSFLLQYSLEPTIEFQRVRVESQFQIGFGPMLGRSSTQLRNVVGSPPGLPDDIVIDRVSGTAFFRGQIGLAIPFRKWFVARTGVQLLAQSDWAPAAAQISHTDFAQQRYHLRTEGMSLGGLFAGFELQR